MGLMIQEMDRVMTRTVGFLKDGTVCGFEKWVSLLGE